jgi:HK97 gp10 family phage protein
MAKNGVQFDIDGLDQINKLLSDLPKEINSKISEGIHREAAKIAKAEIEKSVPVGDNDKPSSNKIENNVVIAKGKVKGSIVVGFSPKVWYVRLIERGTKVRETNGGANRGSMERKPFIKQAHERSFEAVINHLNQNYGKLIEKSLKRLAKKLNKK